MQTASRTLMTGLAHSLAMAAALWPPAAAAASAASEWRPDKRLEIVIPSGTGGGNDRIVRVIQKAVQDRKLTDAVMTTTHKPGAGQAVGIAYLNQLPADGHHVCIASVSFMTNYIIGRSPIGPRDITPLTLLFAEYVGFAVKPDSKLKTGKDLIAALKADSGSFSTSMSGGGAGNHNHLALATVASGVGGDVKKLKIVAYPSGGEAMTAALGGHVDLVVSPAATLLGQVKAGQLRMIAITSPNRLEGPFAQVPTWRELGANAVVSNWRVMIAPRGTPAPPVLFWENLLARVVETDDWKKMLDDAVVTGQFLRRAETQAFLNAQHEELRGLLAGLGLAK